MQLQCEEIKSTSSHIIYRIGYSIGKSRAIEILELDGSVRDASVRDARVREASVRDASVRDASVRDASVSVRDACWDRYCWTITSPG